jgi:hypothetical protein
MREVPGLLAICLTIQIYCWLINNKVAPPAYALLGLSIIITYFVRMPYGVFIGIVVMTALLVEARFNPLALWKRETFYLFLPLITVLVPWFVYLPKLFSTWQWLLNEPNLPEPYALSGWLFYPLATFYLFASTWHLLLAIVSVLWCIRYFHHDPRIRFLLVLVIVQLVLPNFIQVSSSDSYFLFYRPSFCLAVLAWRNYGSGD